MDLYSPTETKISCKVSLFNYTNPSRPFGVSSILLTTLKSCKFVNSDSSSSTGTERYSLHNEHRRKAATATLIQIFISRYEQSPVVYLAVNSAKSGASPKVDHLNRNSCSRTLVHPLINIHVSGHFCDKDP